MTDQTQRLELATVKAEIGSDIISRFSNDALMSAEIQTDSGNIPNLKKVILSIQEDGAEKISFATTIYSTTAAGIAATTNGAIFLVKSDEADEIYAVWQNASGVATDTGKRAMAAQAIQDALQSATEAAQAAEDSADLATARTARFLASVSTPPVIRDDGTPLHFGDRYVNTENQAEYIYKASGWVANDSLAAIADIQNPNDPAKGAALAGYDGTTVADILDQSRPLQDYAVLLAYAGRAARIRITKPGIDGEFAQNESVVSGDGGITFVDWLGRGWQRLFSGPILPEWYGADLTGVSDSTIAVQKAVDAAKAIATATGRRARVHLSGKLRLTPQFYHASTDWRHCVLVGDGVAITAAKDALISTSIAFSNRAVIFLARGDYVSFEGLEFADSSGACFAIGIGGGSTYDSLIGSNRTYRGFYAEGCKSNSLWQTISFQFGTLDDGTVFWEDLTYDRCRSIAKPRNTSSGNFNFRSNPPHKIKNANMIDCKAWNGATASSFNYVGVDTGTIQNCDSWMSLYAAAEIENGCKDISVRGLRSRDDAIGLWIDDSSDVTVDDIDTRNTLPSIVSPLHGTLGLIRPGIKISKQGYDANKDQITGKIQIFGARGKNWSIDINTYTTVIEDGNPLFSTVTIDGFDIDNDPTYLLGSGRGVFFSSVPFLTLRNGYIRGVVAQQILGSSSGGKVTIDNVEGDIKGSENPIGLTITGTSKSCITNSKLQSFTGLPSGSRMEQNCFDTAGARPFVTPGGQKHYYAVIGSPEGVLDGVPGSSARRSDTGQSYNKTGGGVNGWKLVTQAS